MGPCWRSCSAAPIPTAPAVFVGDPARCRRGGERSPVFALGRSRQAAPSPPWCAIRGRCCGSPPVCGWGPSLLPPADPPAPDGSDGWRRTHRRRPAGAACLAGGGPGGLRRSAEADDPDRVRLLCYTNQPWSAWCRWPAAPSMASWPISCRCLPGEVLLTRTAVMAPACRQGEEAAEEPDLVLGSNRELLVHDVQPERCDLREFGVGEAPPIDTLTATVLAGETRLQLRLLPPIGSAARASLEAVLQQLRQEARAAAAKGAAASGAASFWCGMPSPPWDRPPCSRCTAARGAPSGGVRACRCVLAPGRAAPAQLVYVAVSRAGRAVTLLATAGSSAQQQLWRAWLEEREPDGTLRSGGPPPGGG